MKDKESDIAFINHDLRNSIGVAISYLDLLTTNSSELSKNKHIQRAVEGLNHAIKLTETISFMCEANRANIRAGLTIITFNEYLEKYTKPYYEKSRKRYDIDIRDTYKNINLNKYIAVDIKANIRLRENIIINALKAGATVLDVSYEMKENYAEGNYCDNGKGMSPENIDNILLSIHGDGVLHGLGTKSILEAINSQGFYISYSSKIGEGTCVRIIAPYINV